MSDFDEWIKADTNLLLSFTDVKNNMRLAWNHQQKRINELEDAMKTFIMRVNETKSRQDLLVAEATAITRFEELLKGD